MRRVILGFLLLATACGKPSGSGAGSCNVAPANPFVNDKVRLYGFAQAASSETQNQLGFVHALSEPSQTIPAGTEFVAVVHEGCASANVAADAASNKGMTKSGVRSIQWKAPRDMTYGELSEMVRRDQCFVGMGNAVQMKQYQSAPLTASFDSDPMVVNQNFLQNIKASQAYQSFFNPITGIKKDVVIAVIDSGVDQTHEDLKGALWTNPGEIPANGIDDDHNGYIDDVHGWNFADGTNDPDPASSGVAHGTHVAGLAAAQGGNGVGGHGVMPKYAKIMALNVFGGSSGAFTSDIDNAIRYAADNGATVINMSLGGPGRADSTEAAIAYAISKGVTVVVAAGNDGSLLTSTNFQTPSSYGSEFDGMISVGSIDEATSQRSYFSNYSTMYVELGAPGSSSINTAGLLSTAPWSSYMRMQGTSMASPVAAGAAALTAAMIRSRGGTIRPSTIEYLMEHNGRTESSVSSSFKDGKVLDLMGLMQALDTKYPANGMIDDSPLGSGINCGG